jgi:hypothetical protein
MRLIQSAVAWLSFAVVTAHGNDWAGIMRDAPQPAVTNARVREPDDEPKTPVYAAAGSTHLIGGYWYRARGDGWMEWCDECNGASHAEFVRRLGALQKYTAPTRPTQPGGSPGQLPTGTILVPTVGIRRGTERELGWYGASMPMAPTRTFVPGAARLGNTDGCASPGG